MRLKKFKKNNKRNTMIIIATVIIVGLVVSTTLIKSHANFSAHKEFNIIQGKIPNKNNGDLLLAVLVNGNKADAFPEVDGYKFSGFTCTNDAKVNVEAVEGKWQATVTTTSKTVCTVNFETVYENINVDGTVTNEFPSTGDYAVNMNCSDVTNASWDYDKWKPNVSGTNQNSKCNPIFKSMSNIITKITLNGETISGYPDKGSLKNPTITCTDGSTGSWDSTNWKPIISGVTNNTTCTVAFDIYKNITINGSSSSSFPSKGDYAVNLNCTNVSSSSWNYDNWGPVITGINRNSVCNPIFRSMSNITKITLNGTTVSTYPSKSEVKGNPSISCTGGGNGSWDETNWKLKVGNVTNSTSCTVAFTKSCTDKTVDLALPIEDYDVYPYQYRRFRILTGESTDKYWGEVRNGKYGMATTIKIDPYAHTWYELPYRYVSIQRYSSTPDRGGILTIEFSCE